jgi:hypothetical protein
MYVHISLYLPDRKRYHASGTFDWTSIDRNQGDCSQQGKEVCGKLHIGEGS